MRRKSHHTRVEFIKETPVHPTRFPELAYQRLGRDWRFIDTSTGAHVGPQYKSRAELLADLARYAEGFGCNA